MLDFDDGFVPELGSSIISRSGFGRSCDLPGVILHSPCVTCGFTALFRVRIPAHSTLWQTLPVLLFFVHHSVNGDASTFVSALLAAADVSVNDKGYARLRTTAALSKHLGQTTPSPWNTQLRALMVRGLLTNEAA